ncbi:hypothetical protein BJY00DRAFT_287241 [Aspergillus carlsbadensis]|nr:hypothetical protein BJY00DRAFT_287241 [Aspergillus carlsbadensis]
MQELLQIYMTNVHPIFPIVDYESYQAMTAGCSEKTLLSQAICIAVSRDRRAKEYLFLRAQPNMSHADISKSLSSAVTTFISLGLVQDKLVLVQALSLTSLFTQFSGDRQEPAELLSRAICHAHTLGLHHKCHSSAGHDETAGTRLFCCLYALDILNSACLGRPVQLHHRDLGRDLSSSIAAQEGPFQLFLRVIQLMDRVIDIYRPHEDSAWKGAFPSFQELLEAIPADMSAVPVHLIATIEVLYHAVAILSCHSTNMHGISRTPSSESQVRQNLSASSVTHIVGEEFRNELSGFPFVPYAVALALRTSYHSVQRSKAPIFEARARRAFISNCRILQELGGDFHSASLMADLGERLIHESGRQKEASAREIQPNEPQGVENASSLGDNVVIYSQPNLDNIERPDLGETSFHETALFDPMSFLGIFDNFEQELEALGTIV